jgi:phosphatidylinositol alpha 1,6-mannosyltransferase
MRIAYFTESLPPLTDGVARTFTRLAECLNARGIDYLFFSPVLPSQPLPWRGRAIRIPSLGFPLYRYYRVGIPLFSPLERTLDRFRPDLVHVAAPTPLGLYGQHYALRRKLALVSSYHTHFVDYFPYYGFSWAEPVGWSLLKWFHNRGRMTFVPTPGAADRLEGAGFRNLRLWPRGIQPDQFSPAFRDEAFRRRCVSPGVPLLLFVGRLVAEKNLADLARASLLLRGKGCRFRLAFAGDGPFRKTLERLLPHDLFLGFLEGEALSRLYASSDFFVFPSATETFGNVVLEAFASGLPVVAADQGGPVDLVEPGFNGLLAKAHDPENLAYRMRTLLEDPGMLNRLRAGALETSSRWDWRSINGRLLEHYERALEGGPEPAQTAGKSPASGRAAARFLNRRWSRHLPSL